MSTHLIFRAHYRRSATVRSNMMLCCACRSSNQIRFPGSGAPRWSRSQSYSATATVLSKPHATILRLLRCCTSHVSKAEMKRLTLSSGILVSLTCCALPRTLTNERTSARFQHWSWACKDVGNVRNQYQGMYSWTSHDSAESVIRRLQIHFNENLVHSDAPPSTMGTSFR